MDCVSMPVPWMVWFYRQDLGGSPMGPKPPRLMVQSLTSLLRLLRADPLNGS